MEPALESRVRRVVACTAVFVRPCSYSCRGALRILEPVAPLSLPCGALLKDTADVYLNVESSKEILYIYIYVCMYIYIYIYIADLSSSALKQTMSLSLPCGALLKSLI